MFNAEKPNLEELPSSAQLFKSTIIAAIIAIVVFVTIILPAEFAIDPTGAGRFLGLTEMGEIKQELQEEAEQDHSSEDQSSGSIDGLLEVLLSTAYAQSADEWKDEIIFTLQPGDTHEIKLTMKQGQVAKFKMIVAGGRVNFDLHAHGNGQSKTYEKGRGSSGSEGELVAAFDGNHGWFWRNRDKAALTVTLQLDGAYQAITEPK